MRLSNSDESSDHFKKLLKLGQLWCLARHGYLTIKYKALPMYIWLMAMKN